MTPPGKQPKKRPGNKWPLSGFGQSLGRGSGIGRLMDDLGEAIANGPENLCMLGGGQPAHIPAVDQVWRKRWLEIAEDPECLAHVVGDYEPPIGNFEFRTSFAKFLHRNFGWSVEVENIAVTSGGQTAFFFLLNSIAGDRFNPPPTESFEQTSREVLLPLVPEYIGYANQGVGGNLFRAVKPKIDRIGDHRFKYRIDFDSLAIDQHTAAICVSRPTNPTGNVLTDDELEQLSGLADTHQIPLFIDNAYGAPFPGAIFTDAKLSWNENTVLTFSLSKLGLPGTRTAIVVAAPEVIQMVSSMTSIVGLANNNIGQNLVKPLIDSDEILTLSRETICPYYQDRSLQAMQAIEDAFADSLPYRVHVSEGAFFLWMWFEGLPISCDELYERLKERGVLIVPGHHFFFGLGDDSWPHQHQCIRISFGMPEEIVRRGIELIAEEVAKAYG